MMPNPELQTTAPARILIARLSALGDVIQTLPVLAMIREHYPEATIGWLVEADAAPLLEKNPMLDHLHISYRKRWLHSLTNPFSWAETVKEVRSFLHDIARVRYDVALDTQGLFKSSFTLFLTGIGRRIGFAQAREMAPLLYTESIPAAGDLLDPAIPIREHYAMLTQAIGCRGDSKPNYPLPPVTPALKEKIALLLQRFSSTSQPMIILAPATRWESKHWINSHWTELIERILRETPFNVALIGGKQDAALIREILAPITQPDSERRILDLTGQTSIPQLQALFEQAAVVIGPDSAPLHLAGAVGIPEVIGLYGPTSPHRTPPPGEDKIHLISAMPPLPCQPCHQSICPKNRMECMRGLTPDQVFAMLLQATGTIFSLERF